jgi:hypothetical protein
MGGGAPGGAGPSSSRPADDASRPRSFGPDARPKRERERDQRRAAPPKRRTEGGEDPFGGRRGSSRFDDDE